MSSNTNNLIEKPKHSFTRINENGDLEVVCELTGKILARRGGLREHIQNLKIPFDPTLGDIIANRIIEGESLMNICKDGMMPGLSSIARWRRNNEEFDELLKFAYRERAHYHYDRAIEIAESTDDKDMVAQNKLKIDTYKWSAERTNQEQFAAKQTKEEGITATQINIYTGVPQADTVNSSEDRDEGGRVVSAASDIQESVTALTGRSEEITDASFTEVPSSESESEDDPSS